jgi:DeoR family transcriptional regulator, aga operon transcriptional repressor
LVDANPSEPFVKDQRHQGILEAIREDQHVTVTALSDRFAVSEVTVRRDLRELAEAGTLRRVHGGAVASEPAPPEAPVIRRMGHLEACKAAIGQAAAGLVRDGEAVFIGSGSTAAYVARALRGHREVTVITNALTVANELAIVEGVTVVVTGGAMRRSELSLVGHLTEAAVQELRVDKVIIGMRALSPDAGMTNDYLPEVMTDRAILRMAEELIVVADHTKFDKVAPALVAPVELIRTLVTDSHADPETLAQLRALGIRVLTAEIKEDL